MVQRHRYHAEENNRANVELAQENLRLMRELETNRTQIRDKIVEAFRALRETYIPVNRALEIVVNVTDSLEVLPDLRGEQSRGMPDVVTIREAQPSL